MTETSPRLRYRFAEFTLSPSTRLLLKGTTEVPLIPRYFDLLLLLVERRNEAVTRDVIFDEVWSDVIVSDGALTQAIRILRKSLGDRAKDPKFIRTVSRHGYRFIYDDVVEEPEHDAATADRTAERPAPATSLGEHEEGDSLEAALAQLLDAKAPANEDEEAMLRDAAETVLRLGRGQDFSRLNVVARALLRDARWDLPDSGEVPLLRAPRTAATIRALVRLRIRRTWKLARTRWLGAILGGAGAGVLGGLLGALVLLVGPGSRATASVLIALPLVGVVVGGVGAFGVGGGLAWAEALVRSHRGVVLSLSGAIGGGVCGGAAHFIGLYTVEGLFGRDLSPIGGGFEGLVLGAAVGLGYALATPVAEGGMAAPRGAARLRAAAAAGIVCAAASVLLAVTGHHMGAMSLDFTAQSFPGSQVSLDPLARLLGESSPGHLTNGVISGFEGFLFGLGVISGLTIRPDFRR